ncbi:U2 snRNP-associated SURP motif-containing protein [Leucoagaricus sp. SymC.cos]|nr:U2 snRNP-associated SURP motif-containing protein [Leucoagaricus sp. SymC.cos]
MDKTKTKLAAFFDDSEDSSFPQKPVDEAKLSQYTSGTVRKSRREKEQEAAEAKKRDEEEQAAKAYVEFLDAFQGDDAARRKRSTFVKAGSDGTEYNPLIGTEGTTTSARAPTMDRSASPPMNAPKPKGKRAMDAFLEEIKRDQAEREAKYAKQSQSHGRSVTALAAYEGQSGSKDRGDPQTSNVFVANLPPHVTEETLGNFFARVGPVGSVKIMWPRSDATVGPGADMTASRRSKAGLSGFVSFMKRRDAEEALREFDGYDWGGSILRVGWSKAVPLAVKPKYEVRLTRIVVRMVNTIEAKSGVSRVLDADLAAGRAEEAVTDIFIRAVAAEVKGQDSKYEDALREHERNNPKYSFLIHKNHRRHAFYRGLIESERALKPEFDDEGYNSVYSTDSAEESERERSRKNKLGKLAKKRFEAMLRGMSGKRGEISRCMAFSLEHAEAAHEVADIIVASLLVDGTAVPRKVARLHLICDILHNSAAPVPSAWKFRQEFQSRLGIVFDHLANIYHSSETFKKQILAVVEVWEDWIVFPADFTSELRQRLEGAMAPSENTVYEQVGHAEEQMTSFSSRFKQSSFKLATDTPPMDEDAMDVESDIDGKPVGDVDGEPALDDVDGVPVDDVDGEPIEDADGEPLLDNVDEEPVEDVDGEPVDIDGIPVDDIDGEPVDDLDGVPIS